MAFDNYIRRVSIAAIVCAAIGYFSQVASNPCDRFFFSLPIVFVQLPALACALVLPLIWRLVQRRPIERRTVMLASWAAVATAIEVTVALLSPVHGCFK